MIVSFSIIRGEDDIIVEEYEVLDKYDYCECKEKFANKFHVDYSQVNDDLEPEEYKDLFGITFFGDRAD